VKNLLIIFNVLFLLAGNALFLNVHHLNDHNHEAHNDHECIECVILKNNNYFSEFNDVNFLQNITIQLVLDYSSIIEFEVASIYHSRAPPLS
tara:strand:+ start:377 stop:652 length:276 start_codon:yes stop_codon:yes gene_type:complete